MFQKIEAKAIVSLMYFQYKDYLSEKNISNLSISQINKILFAESQKHKDAYVRFLLGRWISDQSISSLSNVANVKKTLRKLRVKLSEEDLYDMELLEERAFSNERHIKVLEVDVSLRKRESVGAKFENAKLFVENAEDNEFKLVCDANLFISNQRLIVEAENEVRFFDWPKISAFWFKSYGFKFDFNHQTFLLRIHDQETLNNTISNIIKKKARNVIKKRQDN